MVIVGRGGWKCESGGIGGGGRGRGRWNECGWKWNCMWRWTGIKADEEEDECEEIMRKGKWPRTKTKTRKSARRGVLRAGV